MDRIASLFILTNLRKVDLQHSKLSTVCIELFYSRTDGRDAKLTAARRSSGLCCVAANPPLPGATVIPLLPPGPGNPRNTEGAFVTLRDGRILFAYSHFSGGGGDNDAATIVGRFSSDGGRTWTATDVPIVDREGDMNVMSVSLLRLQDGRIALFYVRKNSVSDCRPYLRYSSDEAKTWSEPVLCIRDEGYFVLNNDRAVQLRSGRILLPVALHPCRRRTVRLTRHRHDVLFRRQR